MHGGRRTSRTAETGIVQTSFIVCGAFGNREIYIQRRFCIHKDSLAYLSVTEAACRDAHDYPI